MPIADSAGSAIEIGLLGRPAYERFLLKQSALERGVALLDTIAVKATAEVDEQLAAMEQVGIRQKSTLTELLRRPGMTIDMLCQPAAVPRGATGSG